MAFLLFVACNGVFVPDPIDPRVPKYTEEGNNVAGAFINGNIWQSIVTISFPYVYNEPTITVSQENNRLVLKFTGSTSQKEASIEFHLTGLNISKFEDLTVLEGQKIQLDGIKNSGYYTENYAPPSYINKGIGQIYFRNVRMENSLSKIIFSGTFGFSVHNSNGYETKVSFGRFDYQITESSNFQNE
jgi:hypothetical protein